MGWWQQLRSETGKNLLRTGLPRKVLRQLIFSHEIGIGSRVLVAGSQQGELVRYFDRLGIAAQGLVESADALAALRQTAPHLDFHQARADHFVPIEADQFDLVLLRGLDVHRGNLLSSTALTATAQLISCVRPGGFLAILGRVSETSNDGNAGHADSCYAEHLSCFSKFVKTAQFRGRIAPWGIRKWFPRSHGGSRFFLASLRSPVQPRSRADWLDRAETIAGSYAETCCSFSGQADGRTGSGRAA